MNYRILTREQLFLFHHNGNYILHDHDTSTEDNLVFKFAVLATIPIVIIISIEANLLNIKSHEAWTNVLARNIFLMANLAIVSKFPHSLDKFIKKIFGVKFGALCTYDNHDYQEVLIWNNFQGLKNLGFFVLTYFFLMYITGWILERVIYKPSKIKKIDRRRSEISISKGILRKKFSITS